MNTRRDPSLGRMFIASMALHLVVLLSFSVSGLFRTKRYIAPNPYFVDLVPASSGLPSAPPAGKPSVTAAPKKIEPKPAPVKKAEQPKAAPKKPEPPESKTHALESIGKTPSKPASASETAASEAAARVREEIERLERIRNLERLTKLREAVGGAGSETSGTARGIPSGGGSGGGSPEKMAVYYGIIRLRVMESWILQNNSSANPLEAEVLINIGKEGGVLQQKIEKSSGNADFDRSVMRAIAKASPFPPPPEGVDTEIQFKFAPKEDLR